MNTDQKLKRLRELKKDALAICQAADVLGCKQAEARALVEQIDQALIRVNPCSSVVEK